MSSPSSTHPTPDPGLLGEQLVAQWVATKGGTVLYQRWHCRFGELDVVALNAAGDLIFIEVKTRQPYNWDSDGSLAVTRQKQTKLWKTAQIFLLKHPQHRDRPCRFDLALVHCSPRSHSQPDHPGFSRTIANYHLTLVNYLINALEFNQRI
ncbi:YraN family protein [Alkalinema sp. FACHB-956]|uniref:YraN family protein n=1 Tax=Alkalinema sp. FACHB-956 TaxID=2692768 RepID=UPI001685C216|nr:YraN family protein [Alkalinema sp. FACHB-956]MBD2327845.1 YraN family protein [Alkalinema sp. FACHB-956]